MNSKWIQLGALCAWAISSTPGAQAAEILLSDDFESYTAGQSLTGQSPWVAIEGSVPVTAGNGNFATKHIDMRAGSAGGFTRIERALSRSFADGDVTTARFEAIALDANNAHNSWFQLGADGVAYIVTYNVILGGWTVSGPGFTDTVLIGDAVNTLVTGEIVADGIADEVFVRISTSTATFETSRVSVTAADIEALGLVRINADERNGGGRGLLFDNIEVSAVSAVPEPATAALAVLGGVALARRRGGSRV